MVKPLICYVSVLTDIQVQILSPPPKCGPVAQLEFRAFDYESRGRRFESCRVHQITE